MIGEITGAYARQHGNTLYKSERAFDIAISYAKTSSQAVENVKGFASEIVEVYGPAAALMTLNLSVSFLSGDLKFSNIRSME